MKKLITLSLLVATIFTLQATPPGKEWFTDFAAAQKAAKESNKKIYILFTGSDWCPYCKILAEKVLTNAAFINFAQAKLVLLYIDFPRSAPLPPKQEEANTKLYEQYEVEGFPTQLILNPDGKVLGQVIGIQSPAVCIMEIEAILKKSEQQKP